MVLSPESCPQSSHPGQSERTLIAPQRRSTARLVVPDASPGSHRGSPVKSCCRWLEGRCHPHNRLVEGDRPRRAEERSVPEGEEAATGGHEPGTRTGGGGGHPHN